MLQHRSRTNNLYDRPLRHATRRGEMRRQGSSSPLPRGGGGEENTSSCLGNGSSGELPTTHPTTNTLHLTPFTHTLHPTPYTLQPTPCTLHSHPKPYTRHPTPDTLHPTLTPQTLHPAPYTIHPTPHMTRLGRRTPQAAQGMDQAGNSRPPTQHPTSYTLHPTPYTLYSHPDTLHPTPCTRHPTPYTLHSNPPPHTLHHTRPGWGGEHLKLPRKSIQRGTPPRRPEVDFGRPLDIWRSLPGLWRGSAPGSARSSWALCLRLRGISYEKNIK